MLLSSPPRPTTLPHLPSRLPSHEGDTLISLHRQAFFLEAERYEYRSLRLLAHHRLERAALHRGIAMLLRAYSAPDQIAGLHLVRSSRILSVRTPSKRVHPAMTAFLAGSAEEFFHEQPQSRQFIDQWMHQKLLTCFHESNYHMIYASRLLELDHLMHLPASQYHEATLLRRYGPKEAL